MSKAEDLAGAEESAGADELARRCAETMWERDTASQHLQMRLLEVTSGRAVLAMTVRDFMVNGWGMCHGGYVSTLADSAFAFACNSHGEMTVAAGFDITFLRPVNLADELVADAREVSRVGRSGLYDVRVSRRDADGDDSEVVAEMRGRSRSLGTPIL